MKLQTAEILNIEVDKTQKIMTKLVTNIIDLVLNAVRRPIHKFMRYLIVRAKCD